LAAHVEQAGVEYRPLRRGEREDVVAVEDPPDAREWQRVARGRQDFVFGVERRIPPERLPIHAEPDVPAPAERGRATQMDLLVLRIATTREVRVFPRVVVVRVAGDRLEHRPAFGEPRDTLVDQTVHDAGTRDESAPGAEVVADAVDEIPE